MTHDELRKLAEDTLAHVLPYEESWHDLASGVLSLLDELTLANAALGKPTKAWFDAARTAEADLATTRAALGEAAEALVEAKRLRQLAFEAVPVRDGTRDAHFELQHLAFAINGALGKPAIAAALDARRKAGTA